MMGTSAYFDVLMQKRYFPIVSALELRLFCNKPSVCNMIWNGTATQGPVLLTFLRHVARISANGIAAFKESCAPIGQNSCEMVGCLAVSKRNVSDVSKCACCVWAVALHWWIVNPAKILNMYESFHHKCITFDSKCNISVIKRHSVIR